MQRPFDPYFSSTHKTDFPLRSSFHPKEFCWVFLITEDLEAPNRCNHIWSGTRELFNLKRNKLAGSLQGEVRGRSPTSPVWCSVANLRFLQDPRWSPSTSNPEDPSMSTAFAWLMWMDEISPAGNQTIYPPWRAYANPSRSCSRTQMFLQYPCSSRWWAQDSCPGSVVSPPSRVLLAFTAVPTPPNSWVHTG